MEQELGRLEGWLEEEEEVKVEVGELSSQVCKEQEQMAVRPESFVKPVSCRTYVG